MKRILSVLGAVVLGAAVLTACGGGSGNGYGGGGSSAPSSSGPTTAPANGAAAGPAKLGTADIGALGKVVVNGNGRTVYVFDEDTAKPSMSSCVASCAALWPPVPAGSGTPRLSGVDATLVGTVTRPDGSKQLTLAGWPLYEYAKDSKAGEADGQAVGGTWWVIAPDGAKNTSVPASSEGY
ncbi:putative lipoprotein with Yx(FWY)xxD motif [Kribbella amoyensis]|uniref:Putative lipoprotein with Yx(FWY)xxD motif n=1 Tax=Kribbella amoyensis TaxID=996641 RepID=A0A561B0N4_9ACTN|nr:hypothetical protein [Kribbella amoyensis]TWD72420.1 putative lipoprotein with Yx(FWY)xxD motif [Kribbella amoyensis]